MTSKPRRPATGRPTTDTVAKAVQRDLDTIAETAPQIANGALAMTALSLAASIDDPDTSPTARSMCARALVDVISKLNDQVPEVAAADDPIDALASRRAKRKAASA
jgi:hypothetical protein